MRGAPSPRCLAGAALILAVFAPAALAQPEQPAPSTLPAQAAPPAPRLVVDPLAVAGGEEVRAADVLEALLLTHTELVFAALEQSVRRAVLKKEAVRLGVALPDELAAAETERVLKAQQDDFKLAAGPEQDFERYVEERYGIARERYRSAVRAQVEDQMLLARVVRYEALDHERIEARVAVVEKREIADEIAGKLAEGANFAALARQHSIDRSAARGGLLAPVAADCPHPLLAGVKDLSPGQVGEVATLEKEGVTLFRVVKLERRLPPEQGTYAALRERIEAGLLERPVDGLELSEWDRRMRARYPVEVRLE